MKIKNIKILLSGFVVTCFLSFLACSGSKGQDHEQPVILIPAEQASLLGKNLGQLLKDDSLFEFLSSRDQHDPKKYQESKAFYQTVRQRVDFNAFARYILNKDKVISINGNETSYGINCEMLAEVLKNTGYQEALTICQNHAEIKKVFAANPMLRVTTLSATVLRVALVANDKEILHFEVGPDRISSKVNLKYAEALTGLGTLQGVLDISYQKGSIHVSLPEGLKKNQTLEAKATNLFTYLGDQYFMLSLRNDTGTQESFEMAASSLDLVFGSKILTIQQGLVNFTSTTAAGHTTKTVLPALTCEGSFAGQPSCKPEVANWEIDGHKLEQEKSIIAFKLIDKMLTLQ